MHGSDVWSFQTTWSHGNDDFGDEEREKAKVVYIISVIIFIIRILLQCYVVYIYIPDFLFR